MPRSGRPTSCLCETFIRRPKTSTSVPARTQSADAGKKIVGRKRSIVTDTLGLLFAVLVTAASVQDSVAGTHLLDQVAADRPGIHKACGSTAATALGIADHLGCDHTHDQAHHPPDLPQEETAGLPRSRARLIVAKVVVATFAHRSTQVCNYWRPG